MKKPLTIALLLIAVMGCAHTAFAKKSSYKVCSMSDTYSDEINGYIFMTLQKEVKAVVGEDAQIIFDKNILSSDYSIEKAKANYSALQQRCDIILSFGEYSNAVIGQAKSYPKPVIAVGDLRDNVSQKITKDSTSGKHNLLYLTASDNILDGLKSLKMLSDFNTVGIALEEQIVEIIDFDEIIGKALNNAGIKYKLIPYQSLADITRQLDGVDALSLASSYSLPQSDIKKLAQVLIEKKMPSFSSSRRSDVKNGIMASNIASDDLTRFFRRIALSIEAYVNGTNFSKMPVLINFSQNLTVNRNTALTLNIPFQYALIGQINFIGKAKVNPKAETVYNLPQLINDVLNKNLSLRSSKKEIAIQEQGVKSAKSNYLPSVTFSAAGTYIDPEIAKLSSGQNPEFKTAGTVTLQQLLFSADANANIKIQQSLASAQREKFNTEQLDAIFNAANAYFNVLMLKTNVEIQTRNLTLTKKNLQIAEENYKAGQSGKTDLLRFRSQKAQNTQALVEAVNQLNKSHIAINQLTNNDLDTEIDVTDASFEDDIFKTYNYTEFMTWAKRPSIRKRFIDFLVHEAINNSPEIKQLTYNLKAAQQQVKLYSQSNHFIPTVSLQGQYINEFSRSGQGADFPSGFPTPPGNSYNIGINFSFALFNKNSNRINRTKARLQTEQLAINQRNIKESISANMHNGMLDLIDKVTNVELSKVSEESAKEALELTQAAYSNGAVNIVQLIDAQNNYLNAQQAKANATYNYLLKMLQLERYIGNYFLLSTEQDIQKFNHRFLTFKQNAR